MRFHGCLLRTATEQLEGGDGEAIDPEGLDISKLPRLSWNFDPRAPVGNVTRVWREDGRVYVEGVILPFAAKLVAGSVACAGVKGQHFSRSTGTIHGGTLYEVGLAPKNVDEGIPPITLEPDDALSG